MSNNLSLDADGLYTQTKTRFILVYNNTMINFNAKQLRSLQRYMAVISVGSHYANEEAHQTIGLPIPGSNIQLLVSVRELDALKNILMHPVTSEHIQRLRKRTDNLQPATQKKWKKIAEHAITLINEKRFKKDFTLISFAAELDTNETTLKQAFKQETGTTIYQYLLQQRMRHALTMLQGGHSITEVSLSVGYSHSTHFSKAFQSFYGIRPSRSQHLKM